MLRWLRRTLDPERVQNDAVMWLAVCLGFFFLLRASEFVRESGRIDPSPRGVRGADLQARTAAGPAASFRSADEVVLTIRGSKTDKFNKGEVRNHFRTSDPELCVVEAITMFQKHAPERFSALKAEHLLVWASGEAVTRAELQLVLEKAAEACGVAPETIGSHSLRFGGASALWAAYKDTSLVRRWGRWASEGFQSYLWDSRGSASGVASAMAAAEVTTV